MTTLVFLMQNTGRIYGAEQATVDLATVMQQQEDTKAHILLINETRLQQQNADLINLIKQRQLPFTCLSTHHAFSLTLIRKIRKVFTNLNADVLHTSGYKADIHGYIACRKTGTLISTVHGWLCRPQLKERFYAWLNVRFLKHFSRVVVLSSYYRQKLIDDGLSPGRIVRIPSGIAPPPQAAPRPFNTPLTVGLLGRLSWEKNHELFLRSMAEVKRHVPHRIQALIAGEGPERDSIQQLIHELDLENTVTLHSYMDRKTFFDEVDLLVLCSRIENLPLSILEAMARFTPVIATKVGGIPEEIDDGSSGILTEETVPALSKAIIQLAKNEDEAQLMARNAHEKLIREFSQAHWINAHLTLYRDAIAERGHC